MVSRWIQDNQKYLSDNMENLKLLLKHAMKVKGKKDEVTWKMEEFYRELSPPQWPHGEVPSALDNVSAVFNLSEFEKLILLLCAATELDSEISHLCASLQENSSLTYPTFGLVLAFLPKAHWSALSPMSPLRRFRLIGIQDLSQLPLTKCPLRIEERVLHYLTGISFVDGQFHGFARQVHASGFLVESHKRISDNIFSIYNGFAKGERIPLVQLWGVDSESKVEIARLACDKLGLGLWQLYAKFLPSNQEEIDSFMAIWVRESILLGSGLYINAEDLTDSITQQVMVRKLVDDLPGVIILGTREPIEISSRFTISHKVSKPTKREQHLIWKSCFDKDVLETHDNLENEITKIVNQFNFDATTIRYTSKEALFASKNDPSIILENALWQKCRDAVRDKIAELAQQIIPKAKMSDLILPHKEKELLSEIVTQATQRSKVYDEWGFAEKSGSKGLGITALFAGQSGTGKTMAAEVLAHELKLDLFRIDLSMVVSKYIGETEKNLRKVFDAAEDGGVILFFDEADALFAKRTEVKDSHDRYANLEVGYLLQRMEVYTGLAILATNMITAIDTAIFRRIRFVVTFPFPDDKNREQIWKGVFPNSAPLDKLDTKRLAKLNVAGGNIHNIAMNASFIAANQGVPINMSHLKRAAKMEYDKLGRTLTDSEF